MTATYELETLDGKEPEELTDDIEKTKHELFAKLLNSLANGLEDD